MNNLTIFLYGVIIVLLIVLYGKIRCFYPQFDFLAVNKNVYVDGWLMSHFILFALCGYFFPNTFYFAMLLGILWELIEHFKLFSFATKCINRKESILSLNNYVKLFQEHSSDDINNNWWYGKYEDVIVDFIGFVTGYFILKYKFV